MWVIAETNELPVKFARIVVTDARGRYLIPDLPPANYSVWVRGYGLVDSPKLRAKPGRILNHTAVPAPNAAAAAHYYPAIYWYAMMKIPPPGEFGGRSGIPQKMTQIDWLKQVKNIGCIGCHQLGQESTRTIPARSAHSTRAGPRGRSERRLEGPRPVEHPRRPHAVADGRRQGQQAARCTSSSGRIRWRIDVVNRPAIPAPPE